MHHTKTTECEWIWRRCCCSWVLERRKIIIKKKIYIEKTPTRFDLKSITLQSLMKMDYVEWSFRCVRDDDDRQWTIIHIGRSSSSSSNLATTCCQAMCALEVRYEHMVAPRMALLKWNRTEEKWKKAHAIEYEWRIKNSTQGTVTETEIRTAKAAPLVVIIHNFNNFSAE